MRRHLVQHLHGQGGGKGREGGAGGRLDASVPAGIGGKRVGNEGRGGGVEKRKKRKKRKKKERRREKERGRT